MNVPGKWKLNVEALHLYEARELSGVYNNMKANNVLSRESRQRSFELVCIPSIASLDSQALQGIPEALSHDHLQQLEIRKAFCQVL